jgi:hypothetical protein
MSFTIPIPLRALRASVWAAVMASTAAAQLTVSQVMAESQVQTVLAELEQGLVGSSDQAWIARQREIVVGR